MIRYLVVAAFCLAAAPASAQERQIEPAVHRCGIQFGNALAQMDTLGEEVDRLTAERDALKKELAASNAEAAKAKTELETAKKKSEKPPDDMVSITPTQSNVQTAVRDFLLSILGVPVVAGVANRAAEPQSNRFVVMTMIRFERLATNIDAYADCKIAGSISGNVLTVSAVDIGTITPGATLSGTGVVVGTSIVSQTSGPVGGTGTYQVSPAQNLPSQILSAGQQTLQQNARAVMQLDFHSADNTAADLAQTVATAIRDDFGVTFFANLAPPLNGVVPFYADDPKYIPFIDAENQYEWRWVLEAHFQVDQVISFPQTYSDSVDIELIDIE